MRLNTTRNKLFSLFLYSAAIPLLLFTTFGGILFINRNSSRIENFNYEITKQISEQINDLDQQVERAEVQLIGYLVSSPSVGYIRLDSLNQSNEQDRIFDFLVTLKYGFPIIDNIFVILDDGPIISNLPGLVSDTEILKQTYDFSSTDVQKKRVFNIINPEKISETTPIKGKYVSFSRRLIGFDDLIIRMDVNINRIQDILDQLELSDIVFSISDRDGVILSTKNHEDIMNHEFTMIHSIPLDFDGWTLNAYSTQIPRRKSIGLIISLSFSSFIFLIIISWMIAHHIGISIISPITSLKRHMTYCESGDFSRNIPAFENVDFNVLADGYNSMITRIDALIKENYESEKQRRIAEYEALQMQVNPHFLFNTLEMIKGMAYERHYSGVIDTTTVLADLFRYIVRWWKEQDGIVCLYEELRFIEDYLLIQKSRFSDRIHISIFCDEQLKSVEVPHLILQPIVENAFRHGLEPSPKLWKLSISITLRGKDVWIEVQDNGVGMNQNVLSEIRTQLDDVRKSTQVGIVNVHRRISSFFGPEYGVEISSRHKEGTTVSIHIPFERSYDSSDL